MRLRRGNFNFWYTVCLKVDTGAQCNVIRLKNLEDLVLTRHNLKTANTIIKDQVPVVGKSVINGKLVADINRSRFE